MGYVGLPLAVAFCRANFPVLGVDTSLDRVEEIRSGISPVEDVPSEQLSSLLEEPSRCRPRPGRLTATNQYSYLEDADATIICVPTPLNKTRDPDLSHVLAAATAIASHLKPGAVVVLESTTYPGTTEEVVLPILEQKGRRCGEDFHLAFSPERVDPGRSDYTMANTPKVVAGVTSACLEVASALYGAIVDTVVPLSSTKAAETVKLLENTFRAVNIAMVNELAIMCDRLDVDIWEVIGAAKTKPFGFMPFYPGLGLGGHCIPVDPSYLAWKLRTLDYNARFIELATDINLGMPRYALEKIASRLNLRRQAMNGARILVLGVSYKPNVSDVREAPALTLIDMLLDAGVVVTYHDPHVPSLRSLGYDLDAVDLSREQIRQADCVVIATPHSWYDWHFIVENAELVVDTANATAGIDKSDRAVVAPLWAPAPKPQQQQKSLESASRA